MSDWAVRAMAGDATVVFGVNAPTERGATIKTLQRLAIFPDPWPTAQFGLTEEKTITERLLSTGSAEEAS